MEERKMFFNKDGNVVPMDSPLAFYRCVYGREHAGYSFDIRVDGHWATDGFKPVNMYGEYLDFESHGTPSCGVQVKFHGNVPLKAKMATLFFIMVTRKKQPRV